MLLFKSLDLEHAGQNLPSAGIGSAAFRTSAVLCPGTFQPAARLEIRFSNQGRAMAKDKKKGQVAEQPLTPFLQTGEATRTAPKIDGHGNRDASDDDPEVREARLQQRIREKAHEIWVLEGKPNWQQERHWDMAKELIAQADNLAATLKPIEAGRGTVEEADVALGRHGDMPSLTAQVDPPRTRRTAAKKSASPPRR